MAENVPQPPTPLEPAVYKTIKQLRSEIHKLETERTEGADVTAKLSNCWDSMANVIRNSGYPGKTITDLKFRIAKMEILEKRRGEGLSEEAAEGSHADGANNTQRAFAERRNALNRTFERVLTIMNNTIGPISPQQRRRMRQQVLGRINMPH